MKNRWHFGVTRATILFLTGFFFGMQSMNFMHGKISATSAAFSLLASVATTTAVLLSGLHREDSSGDQSH